MFSSQEPNSFVAGVDALLSFTAYCDPTVSPSLNVTKRNTVTQSRNHRRTCCDWDPRLAIRGGGGDGASRPLLQAECLLDMQHYLVPHKAEKEPHNTRSVFTGHSRIVNRPSHRESLIARVHDPPRLETRRDVYPEPPRTIQILEPSIRDSLISCQKSIPSVSPSPKLHTRGPQYPETVISNSIISIRGSITPSVIFNDSPSTLGALEIVHPHLLPRGSPVTSERKVTHTSRALDRSSNPSEDMSVITLPSFVEHERRTPIPSPVLTPPGLLMVEDVRTLPSSRRSSSPLFHSPRSPGRVANITTPTTPPSTTTYPRRDFPSPTLPVPDWRSHSPNRTRSSARRAGMRHELSIPRLKSEIQKQPGIPGSLGPPRTNRLRLGTLPPLKIPTRTSPLLGGGDSQPMGNQPPSYEERDIGVVTRDFPWLVPPRPSPSDTLRGPAEPGGNSPALPTNCGAGPSLSLLSPAFSSSNSPSSCSSPDERRVRVVSRNRSSTSTIPSVSAFPSPPGFTPGSRDGTLLVVSSYSTPRQPFPTAPLWKGNPVGSIEMASPNEGQKLTPLQDAETPQPMPTVNSRSALNGHLHPGLIVRDGTSVWSGVYSRISSMRRLSRTPLGPRQMPRGRTALQSQAQLSSI